MKCIICGRPRWETCLHCGDEQCRAAVHAMPTERLNAIRQNDAIIAWRESQPPADGKGVYIHLSPHEEQ